MKILRFVFSCVLTLSAAVVAGGASAGTFQYSFSAVLNPFGLPWASQTANGSFVYDSSTKAFSQISYDFTYGTSGGVQHQQTLRPTSTGADGGPLRQARVTSISTCDGTTPNIPLCLITNPVPFVQNASMFWFDAPNAATLLPDADLFTPLFTQIGSPDDANPVTRGSTPDYWYATAFSFDASSVSKAGDTATLSIIWWGPQNSIFGFNTQATAAPAPTSAVPLPSSLALLVGALGAGGIGLRRRARHS